MTSDQAETLPGAEEFDTRIPTVPRPIIPGVYEIGGKLVKVPADDPFRSTQPLE